MNKKNYPVANIGSASMLVIFIILCFSSFGVLSLAGANRDYQYVRKIADRTAAWYEASSQAERKLAAIDEVLASASDEEALVESLNDALRESPELIGVSFSSPDTLHYTVPIDDTQELEVELVLHPLKDENCFSYTVTRWLAVSTVEWDGDTTFNLME
ncbi:MAG: hypothetical protein KH828_05825 [Clostridiales bacterium]|nr:hypothetical protein [Clostridiales bacterium]